MKIIKILNLLGVGSPNEPPKITHQPIVSEH